MAAPTLEQVKTMLESLADNPDIGYTTWKLSRVDDKYYGVNLTWLYALGNEYKALLKFHEYFKEADTYDIDCTQMAIIPHPVDLIGMLYQEALDSEWVDEKADGPPTAHEMCIRMIELFRDSDDLQLEEEEGSVIIL